MGRGLCQGGRFVLVALTAALFAPASAAAADVFVGKSTPGASDAGACTDAAAPCATIQAGVDKSEAQGGGEVLVLANPDGETTDFYEEAVTLDGSAPVTLVGAGSGVNGTRIAPAAGSPLDLGPGTTARSLRVLAPSGGTAVGADAGSTLDEAVVEAQGGTAYAGAGRVEDSRLVGATGALLDAARLVRTRVVSTLDGVVARQGTSALLQVIVRPRTTLEQQPTGDALRVGGAGSDARAEVRHVTLTGYTSRVRLDGRTDSAGLVAANSTLADPAFGTDLHLQGRGVGARLRTVNRAPARTVFSDGAAVGHLRDTDPVDLDPTLTPEARLFPSSPLVDRGTREGVLAGNADNAEDIDETARIQGANPDIGADELPPARPDGLRWVSVGTFRDPMYTAAPPGDIDRVFVVERLGRVIVVEDGQILATPALDISAKITGNSQGGLQSIVFAPDFATSQHVYGFYTRRAVGTPEHGDIVIAEWTMDPTNPNRIDPASERQVMLVPHPNTGHNGGGLAFGPDDYLYFSVGDGDVGTTGQDLTSGLGKIYRIDPDPSGGAGHTVPPDNPFVGDPDVAPEIWAYGVRNPFRIALDSATGDLWIGDVGANRYEEVNLLPGADDRVPGANLGWRTTEGDVMFGSGEPVTPATEPDSYHGPAIVHRHDEDFHSVTAGTVVHDPTIAALQDRFLYADFFHGVTRAALPVPGGVSGDGEIEALAAVPGVTSYTADGCSRIYATQLNQASPAAGAVKRLVTTGQCIPPPGACTIEGTAGNDRLVGTSGRDVICGNGGNDRLLGLGGDDLLAGDAGNDELIGGAGADVHQGGGGSDFADYSARTQPVTVTVGGGADDGEAGEGDDVEVDVERVNGGSAGDQLTAGPGRARLVGLAGADVLRGGPANDTLDGREGADEIEGGDGRDSLLGGADADDHLALDGQRDQVVCGPGVDTREADPIDVIDASCE